MNLEIAQKLFREDKNSWGQVRSPMKKLQFIFEELNKEICANCIHSWEVSRDKLACENTKSDMYKSKCNKTFGCNKWELK